ncbi:MAG TPA: winged helix-turn-helix domain-containing protein [Mobilitalea sp.]|nr:winged helix-turn-helix domain-containing protein [Mobilitalea sp.]
MKRQLEIAKHVNLMDEAMLLLYYWINKGDISEVKMNYLDDNLCSIDRQNKRYEIITAVFHEVTEKLKGKKDRIEYYFKERGSEFSTLGALAILWGLHDYNNELLTYEERFHNIDEAKKVKTFAGIIHDQEAVNKSSEEFQTLSDLVRFIEGTPYEKEAKWEAIRIYNNQEPYYKEVYDILAEVMELIGRHSSKIAELEQEFYDYWSEYQKDNDILDTINEKLKISWNSEKTTLVIPLLFLPYGITITITEPDTDMEDIIRISFLMNKDFIITERKINKEDVINVGKLLSDKSKVEILEIISKKPCYGKEIANELNLSTATISYHVNALLKIGFIKADLISNKVYYSSDKDRISAYLDDMKEYFTKL